MQTTDWLRAGLLRIRQGVGPQGQGGGFLEQLSQSVVNTVLFILLPVAVLVALGELCRRLIFPALAMRAERRGLRAPAILFRAFTSPAGWILDASGVTLGLYMALEGPAALHDSWALAAPAARLVVSLGRIFTIIQLARGLYGSSEVCTMLLSSAKDKLAPAAGHRMLDLLLERVYKVGVLVCAGLVVLQEIGFPVTGVVTGVGLAGLVVTLGAQDTASNLFAGLILGLDSPFSIGDWIQVGETEGTVEELSLRSTRIRTLDRNLVTLPNSVVADSQIINMSLREKWLSSFKIGLLYSSDSALMQRVLSAVETLLRENPLVAQDRVIVRMTGFAESSLDVLIEFHLKVSSRLEFLEKQQEVMLQILDTVRANGGEFAFPSRTVYLEGNAAKTT